MSHVLRHRIGNPETAHRVSSPEEYVAWIRVQHVGLGGQPEDVGDSGLELPAYVSDGRWVVQCPCGNCPSAHPEWLVAACVECGAVHRVAVPASWRRGEAALLSREHLRWRTWFPTKELAEKHGRAAPDSIRSLERGDTAHDSWTAPRSWTTGELVTAAMLNTHLRDNLLETAPAKVTTAGDLLYGTGANALARLAIGSSALLGISGGLPAWTAGPSVVSLTVIAGPLAVGSSPADAGGIVRLPNGVTQGITFRNNANNNNFTSLCVDSSDTLLLGSGANNLKVDPANGTIFGTPSGSYKGGGTINAVAVWRNGTSLDHVFEDAYALPSIREMRAYYEEHRQLPTLPTGEVHEDGSTNMGALTDRLWETVEVQARYIAELDARLAALEGR
jgi:hypothetical protein